MGHPTYDFRHVLRGPALCQRPLQATLQRTILWILSGRAWSNDHGVILWTVSMAGPNWKSHTKRQGHSYHPIMISNPPFPPHPCAVPRHRHVLRPTPPAPGPKRIQPPPLRRRRGRGRVQGPGMLPALVAWTKRALGGSQSHEGTPNWMVFDRENPF